MTHVNQVIRKKNYHNIQALMRQNISYAHALQINLNALRLYDVNQAQQVSSLYLFLGVYFLDYYTKLIYRRNENHMSLAEQKDYSIMTHVENFRDILSIFSQNSDILFRAACASDEFETMNIFGQINMVKNLSQEENEYLNLLVPTHQEDQEMYGGWVDVDLYQSFYQVHYKIHQNRWENVKKEYILPTLFGFLKNLSKHDYVNYSANIGEMSAYDYLYSKYILDSEMNLSLDRINQMKYHIRFLKNHEYETMVYEVLTNAEYAYSLLENYLDLKTGLHPYLPKNMTDQQIQAYVEQVDPKGYAKIKEFLF